MTLERITASAIEPVTVEVLKQHLRLDHDEEDVLLAQMITAARQFLETKLSLAFLTARWRYRPRLYCTQRGRGRPAPFSHQAQRSFKKPSIKMPLFPISQLHHIKLYLSDGTTALADLSHARIESAARPAFITGLSLPSMVQVEYGAEFEFSAGYGALPEDVPSPLRLAITMLAAYFYENRIDSQHCLSASLPATISLILMDYMEVRLK